MLRRTQTNAAATDIETDDPAPVSPPPAPERPRLRLEPAPVERRKGERRGMEALRAEALQTLMSNVEDRNFSGLRTAMRPAGRGMRFSRILLIGVALLAGGSAAYLALQRTPQPAAASVEVAPAPAPAPLTQVLVARTPIGVGERLSEASVEWVDWPESAIRPGYITSAATPQAITDMGGAIARFEFFPGEPIRDAKLVRAEQGYLSAVLATGMRGVSVSVAAEAASGGFIVPNDHVDVVLTRATENGAQVSQTLVRNVRVLAIGTRLGETGTTGAPSEPDNPRAEIFADHAIATLELDPTQAETVINATAQGRLSLELRSIVDFAALEKPDANQTIRMTSPFWNK